MTQPKDKSLRIISSLVRWTYAKPPSHHLGQGRRGFGGVGRGVSDLHVYITNQTLPYGTQQAQLSQLLNAILRIQLHDSLSTPLCTVRNGVDPISDRGMDAHEL